MATATPEQEDESTQPNLAAENDGAHRDDMTLLVLRVPA